MAGIERWESHECNKPGQLQTDYSVYKKRIAERAETTAVVQGVVRRGSKRTRTMSLSLDMR